MTHAPFFLHLHMIWRMQLSAMLWVFLCFSYVQCFLTSSYHQRLLSVRSHSDLIAPEEPPEPVVNYQVGFVFPDVGGQYGSMAGRLCKDSVGAREIFNEASSILGYDLLQKCAKQSNTVESELVIQPAVFVTAMAALEYLKETDPDTFNSCTVAMGLSLGELSALCFADVISFEDGVKLAKMRGQAIQYAAEQSNTGMALVTGKIHAALEQLCLFACKKSKEALFVSMLLEDEEFVISGTTNALVAAAQVAIDHKANIEFLPRPVGLHCPFGAPASQMMFEALQTVQINPPRIPVLFNSDLSAEINPTKIRMNIAGALSDSVHWSYLMKRVLNDPQHKKLIEIGPGNGLSGRIIKHLKIKSDHSTFP